MPENPTGRSFGLTRTGTITLYNCGGRSFTHYKSWWVGSNYQHETSGYYIQFRCFGLYVRITVASDIANPFNPGHQCLSTSVEINGEVIKQWVNDEDYDWDDANPDKLPPSETITLNVAMSLTCNEWLVQNLVNTPPISFNDEGREFYLKPAGSVHIEISGSGVSASRDIAIPASYLHEWIQGVDGFENDYSIYVDLWGYHFKKDDFYNWILNPAQAAIIGKCESVYANGIQEYFVEYTTQQKPGEFIGGRGYYVLDKISNYEFSFPNYWYYKDNVTEFQEKKIFSFPSYNVNVKGVSKNFDGEITGTLLDIIRCPSGTGGYKPYDLFDNIYITKTSPIITSKMTYARLHDNVNDLPLEITETESQGLTIERLSSLEVLKFSSYADWILSNCTTAIVDGALVVTPTGASPNIGRVLKSDYNDIVTDGALWFTTHWADLPQWIKDWYNGYGLYGTPQLTKVAKKLLSGSDIFNWSAYRYLYLKAKADAACDITLRIHWNEMLSGGSSLYEGVVNITIPLDTNLNEKEVDICGWIDESSDPTGEGAFKYVWQVDVLIPNDRIITLDTITMRQKETPKIDVHNGNIYIREAGKNIIFLYSFPNWIYHPTSFIYPRSWPTSQNDRGYTTKQVVDEINLQEGFNATLVNDINTSYLQEIYSQNLPYTIPTVETVKHYKTYPGQNNLIDVNIRFNHGKLIYGIVYKEDEHKAIQNYVRLEEIDIGTLLEIGELGGLNSNSSGIYELKIPRIGAVNAEIQTSPETPYVLYFPVRTADIPNPLDFLENELYNYIVRGHEFPVVSGYKNPVIICDEDGNKLVAVLKDADLKIIKWMGYWNSTREEYLIGSGGAVWAWPEILEFRKDNPIFFATQISPSAIYVLYNTQYGVSGFWSFKMVASGTYPVIVADAHFNLIYITYWRSNAFYLKAYNMDLTESIPETLVKNTVTEQPLTFCFTHDINNTIIGVYTDSGNLVFIKSEDDGLTWSVVP